jgi:apolipoprotein N-acyltransferase
MPPSEAAWSFTQRPNAARLAFFAAGALLTLAFAPFGLWMLAPLLVVPVMLASLHGTPRQAAALAFCFGAGLFLCGTYWLYISIHVFGRAPLWLAIGLMMAVVLIMAAWYAAVGWLGAWIAGRDPWRLVLFAPAAWLAVEWLRGWFLSGFPWLTLGYSQPGSPLAGWLPVVGVYGVSLLVALSAAAAVAAFQARLRWLAIVIAILPWVGGALLQQASWTVPAGDALTVTVIQGGVSQDRKWLPEQFQPTLSLYRDGLLAAADSDIVVWPEVAIPDVVDRVEPYLELLQRDIRSRRQTLLLGILERDNGRVYNSVLLLDGGDRQVYRKRHLVPFGEYFPVPDFIREWMRLMSLPNSDLHPGAERQPLLTTASGLDLAVAICYEDAYGAEQLYALPDAGILVNVSNDAWFGDSIAPHQHLEIARVRALEAGRYVVRATNNGVSALIAPDGALLATAPQFEYASMTFKVTPMRGLTPYARTGNWPVVSLALVLLLCGAYRMPRHAVPLTAVGNSRKPS